MSAPEGRRAGEPPAHPRAECPVVDVEVPGKVREADGPVVAGVTQGRQSTSAANTRAPRPRRGAKPRPRSRPPARSRPTWSTGLSLRAKREQPHGSSRRPGPTGRIRDTPLRSPPLGRRRHHRTSTSSSRRPLCLGLKNRGWGRSAFRDERRCGCGAVLDRLAGVESGLLPRRCRGTRSRPGWASSHGSWRNESWDTPLES